MAEHNSLVGKKEQTIDIERKEGLLDELNLPPAVIKFIHANARNLQIVAGCIVLLVFGWTYYDYYTQTKESNASAALNLAVQAVDGPARASLLKGVVEDFAGTEAARWSNIEQAHVALQAGDYAAALSLYNRVMSDLDSDSPLLPLMSYNVGLTYENSGDVDKALAYYKKLAAFKGFEVRGLMAQGRIHELRGEQPEALQLYRAASEKVNVSSRDKDILTEKLKALQPVGTGSAGS